MGLVLTPTLQTRAALPTLLPAVGVERKPHWDTLELHTHELFENYDIGPGGSWAISQH